MAISALMSCQRIEFRQQPSACQPELTIMTLISIHPRHMPRYGIDG